MTEFSEFYYENYFEVVMVIAILVHGEMSYDPVEYYLMTISSEWDIFHYRNIHKIISSPGKALYDLERSDNSLVPGNLCLKCNIQMWCLQ